MIFLFGGLLGAALCFVALYLVAVTRHKATFGTVEEPLVIEAKPVVNPNLSVNLKPAHREYSRSEQRELSEFINSYVAEHKGASDMEIAQAIVVMAEIFDDALRMRYEVKG